jgi:hypothetical protein
MCHYFWCGLSKDVTNNVWACGLCHRVKTHQHKPFGLLKTLVICQGPWASISMDHIMDLPICKDCGCILIVVCRLTKQAVFLPTYKTDNAKDLVRIFITNVCSKHGFPLDITSDRGPAFVSMFGRNYAKP